VKSFLSTITSDVVAEMEEGSTVFWSLHYLWCFGPRPIYGVLVPAPSMVFLSLPHIWCFGSCTIYGVLVPAPSMVFWFLSHLWCFGPCPIYGVLVPAPSMVFWSLHNLWCFGSCHIYGVLVPAPSMVFWSLSHLWCFGSCTIYGVLVPAPSMMFWSLHNPRSWLYKLRTRLKAFFFFFFVFRPSKTGPIGCPRTSARSYLYSLPNNSAEWSFHLPRCGSLKSRLAHIYGEATLRYSRLCTKKAKHLSLLSFLLRCRVQNTYRLPWKGIFRASVVRRKVNARAWHANLEHGPHFPQAWRLQLSARSPRVLQTGLIWVPKPENIPAQVMYIYIYIYIYVSFKTSFYVVRHLDSSASYLPTGLHLGFFRSWPSLYLPSSFSSVFLVLSFVSASTSMLFWMVFLLLFFGHGRTM